MSRGDGNSKRYSLGSKKKREGRKSQVSRHESQIADQLGGHSQIASGATPLHKGDISIGDDLLSLDRFLLESKETTFSSITVDGKTLTKITKEAMEASRFPGLVITIEQVPPMTPNTWVAVPIELFASMLRARKNNGDG